ncbi:uncharacterized protein ColSpa_12798 [Colletotrichum spaethianum]|uniref:Uncharacterized protein n=1 Tax=Colletotrichum spaethianum TaxID=700344 RepID=A0AA37PI60_9PEZI|nr:uncharacterized protein ColSpa_12798 [Colletotrichum spaethianum]GKT52617.1 hypothetical protein ColSpa_12798 [Colletotrichum spaethianum]
MLLVSRGTHMEVDGLDDLNCISDGPPVGTLLALHDPSRLRMPSRDATDVAGWLLTAQAADNNSVMGQNTTPLGHVLRSRPVRLAQSASHSEANQYGRFSSQPEYTLLHGPAEPART